MIFLLKIKEYIMDRILGTRILAEVVEHEKWMLSITIRTSVLALCLAVITLQYANSLHPGCIVLMGTFSGSIFGLSIASIITSIYRLCIAEQSALPY